MVRYNIGRAIFLPRTLVGLSQRPPRDACEGSADVSQRRKGVGAEPKKKTACQAGRPYSVRVNYASMSLIRPLRRIRLAEDLPSLAVLP